MDNKTSFLRILEEKYRVDIVHIQEDDQFVDLGLDSLEMIALICDIENLLHIVITQDEMENIITLSDVFQLIEQRYE